MTPFWVPVQRSSTPSAFLKRVTSVKSKLSSGTQKLTAIFPYAVELPKEVVGLYEMEVLREGEVISKLREAMPEVK